MVSHKPGVRGPLDGLKILEFDEGLGQFAGKLLADLGANVLKVEPLSGSPTRRFGPYAPGESGASVSLSFRHYNTNKESMAVDLETASGRKVVEDLVINGWTIILDATQKGIKASGLDPDLLGKAQPGLIYERLTPFGETGPMKDFLWSDAVLLAMGGVTAMNGYDQSMELPPIAPTGGQAAHLAGMYAAIGILGAVAHRDNTGEGQAVSVAAHDVLAVSTELSIPYWEYKSERVHRQTARHARPDPDTPHQVTMCADGKYIAALSLYLFDEMRFPAMVKWMDESGMAGDLTDPEYSTAAYRFENIPHINQMVHRFCLAHDSDWLFKEAQKRRLPWAPVNRPGDLIDDPHVRARDAVIEVDDEELGSIFYPGRPYLFSETPWSIRRTAPKLGADSARVLGEIGLTGTQVRALHEVGAIGGIVE